MVFIPFDKQTNPGNNDTRARNMGQKKGWRRCVSSLKESPMKFHVTGSAKKNNTRNPVTKVKKQCLIRLRGLLSFSLSVSIKKSDAVKWHDLGSLNTPQYRTTSFFFFVFLQPQSFGRGKMAVKNGRVGAGHLFVQHVQVHSSSRKSRKDHAKHVRIVCICI